MKKHTILYLICLFFFTKNLVAQTSLIELSSKTRYEFTIKNLSEATLSIALAKKYINLQANESKIVANSKAIKMAPYLHISYPKSNFRIDTLTVNKTIRKNLESQDMWAEIQEFIQGLSWKEQEVILKEYALSSQVVKLYKKSYDFNEMYNASSKKKKNKWLASFRKIPIDDYVNVKHGITPKTVLTIGFPISRKNINNFFEKKASKISFDAHFAIRMLKDIRMGKKSTSFLSFFAFANYERLGYRYQATENSSVLVAGRYLNSNPDNLVVLQNQDGINVFDKTLSTGAYLKLLGKNGLFLDLGFGYDLTNNIQLEFILADDANPYFKNGDRFESNKISNIGEKTNPIHGILRIGSIDTSKHNSKELNRLGGLIYAFSLKFFTSRQFFPTDNYQLFTESPVITEPQLIPLSKEKNSRFEMQLNFNIGFTF